jgi:multiple sugar transport system substrate-binding protein
MIARRSMLVGGFAVVATTISAPGIPLAQQRTVNWITHPVIFDVTGKGELLKKFTEQTGIKVEVTTFPTDALAQRIPAEFIANSDAFDLMSIAESFWTTSLARFAEPLEPFIEKSPLPAGGLADFSGGMVQQFRVPQTAQGRIYGIPNRMSADILFYRKDLLAAAGLAVPKTLDEYYEVAKKLTNKTPGQEMFGVVYQGIQSQQGVLDWYDWAAPQGVDILTPPDWKQAAFNTPAAVKTLELRRRMVAEGLASPGVLSYSFDDAINAMAQGRAAMSIMSPAYWTRLEDPKSSTIAGKVGYAAAPRDPAVKEAYFVRGWSLVLNKASKNKDAAWELIKFLTAPEQQAYMAINHGNPISRISVLRNPDVAAKIPVSAAAAEALASARIQPNSPALPRVWDALAKHISAAQAGSVSAADALAAAERDVAPLLK